MSKSKAAIRAKQSGHVLGLGVPTCNWTIQNSKHCPHRHIRNLHGGKLDQLVHVFGLLIGVIFCFCLGNYNHGFEIMDQFTCVGAKLGNDLVGRGSKILATLRAFVGCLDCNAGPIIGHVRGSLNGYDAKYLYIFGCKTACGPT